MRSEIYRRYGIPHPRRNAGENQVCEIDHLVPLELGGSDSIENLWPQCGPPDVRLRDRYFKQKDLVENYLSAQVKEGAMDLAEAQRQIARDWTSYLRTARAWCATHRCAGER